MRGAVLRLLLTLRLILRIARIRDAIVAGAGLASLPERAGARQRKGVILKRIGVGQATPSPTRNAPYH
jgi:hypothetical protein